MEDPAWVVSAGPAYDFKIVAQANAGASSTSVRGQPLLTLKNGPGINDSGRVIFVGTYAGGQAVVAADTASAGGTALTVLDDTSSREFGGVWINNNNQACARYRTISPATFSGIKRYSLTLDGQVLANAGLANDPQGSGGGISVRVQILRGGGRMEARGGSSSYVYGGGGGGRIAVYAQDMSGFSLTNITAVGGTGSANGGAGTIYLKRGAESYGELWVDNRGISAGGWSTPLLASEILRLDSLTIAGNARVSTTAGMRVLGGNPASFAGLISGGYLQVGSLLVSNTWVFGDVIEPVMSRSNGVPLVTVYCRPQKTYVLLATTNFVDWSAVGTFTPTDSSFTFADTNAPSFGKRFFRAVMLDHLYDSIGISYSRTNQQAGVTLTGAQPNHTLVLQASDNLRNWNAIATVIPSAVTNWQFLDTNAPSFQKRFYRAIGQGR